MDELTRVLCIHCGNDMVGHGAYIQSAEGIALQCLCCGARGPMKPTREEAIAAAAVRTLLTSPEAVERVARAIADGLTDFAGEPRATDAEWSAAASDAREMFEGQATAALTALLGDTTDER